MAAKPELKVTEGSSGLRIDHLRKSYRKKVRQLFGLMVVCTLQN